MTQRQRQENPHIRETSGVKQIRKMIAPSFWVDCAFCILCCLVALLTIGEPLLLSGLLDLVTDQQIARCGLLSGLIIMIFLLRIGLDFLKSICLLKYRNHCIQTLSSRLFRHILSVKTVCLESVTPSYLVSRMTDELTNIDGILDFTIIDHLINLIICAVIFILMLRQSWLIALITAVMVAADAAIAFRLPLTRVYRDFNETQARLKSETVNTLQGMIPIKMGTCRDREAAAFEHGMKEFLTIMFHKNHLTRLQRMSGSVCRQSGYLLLIVVSAFLMALEKIGLGQFTMLLCLYNLIWSHIASVENIIPLYKYGKVTCDRIIELLEMEPEEAEPEEAEPDQTVPEKISRCGQDEKPDCVELSEVCFSYQPGRQILDQVSLRFRAGEMTAIAGYSGCGKSTVLQLLMGFYQIDSGQIRIGGRAMEIGDLIRFRSRIGYVGQNGFLFNRSVRDNLLYYVENTEENADRAKAYLEQFQLTGWVESLPGGLDYMLTENSGTISGGEKQRLCIIRELMKKPEVLLLDECTAHLDAVTEHCVFQVLKQIQSDMIIIQVAHKAAALASSDMVYVMEDGQVTESGSHQELQQRSAYYREVLKYSGETQK